MGKQRRLAVPIDKMKPLYPEDNVPDNLPRKYML